MNEKLSTIINKFGLPVLAIAGTAATILAGVNPTTLAALPLNIATNLLSSKLNDVELINRLKNIPPEKLNNDIFRVSRSAVKLALKATIDSFEIEYDISKRLKKKVDEICNQLEDNSIWDNITTKDIIDCESNLSENDSKWSDLFSNELNGEYDIFENTEFGEKFQIYFYLYFGEYLKTDQPAYIAYEREMQKIILNAVNDLKITLNSQSINLAIKESIAKYIEEIPIIEVNTGEIKQEIQELRKYFQTKKIIIREIKADKLLIEIPPNEIKEIGNNYGELNAIIADKYYFEYNNHLYPINELNEETFYYLTGKIKCNQLFTKRIIESIKNDCAQQHAKFYGYIEQEGTSWSVIPRYCAGGMQIISENFVGIIGEQLHKLFAIGKENNVEDKYIKKCLYIVNRALDLVIFTFLSQLWDDVHTQKLILPTEKLLRGLFTMNLEMAERIALLRHLNGIYKEQKINDEMSFITDVLKISDQFNEDNELYAACTSLEKLGKNSTILDCYFAEKYMTVFFESFRFLVNYKIASMKKIEYYNIKNVNVGYLHHYVNAGYKSKEEEKRNFNNCNETINSLFTNAVLLYKGMDYTKNINLFPFVIDYNALTLEKNSKIAFFKQEGFNENELEYTFLDTAETFELEYKGIVQQRGDTNVVFLTDEDMKVYNKDCVFDTFREIQKELFTTI